MQDVYQRVTDTIIAQIEAGTRPWAPSWKGSSSTFGRPIRVGGEPYKGVNVLMLWAASMGAGYTQPKWMTFKQALALGGAVRKGEHGSLVVYANQIVKDVENKAGEIEQRSIGFMKGHTVFNVEQIDGIGPEHYTASLDLGAGPDKVETAERFFDAIGANVSHGGGQAFYSPEFDRIQLPLLAAFDDATAYYGTRAHETVHWTRHATRLNRSFGRERWGDTGYATEELVAEIGAAYVGAGLGLEIEPREDHAAYLTHWLGVLKADKRAIFTAASHAQAACDYLEGLAAAGGLAVAA